MERHDMVGEPSVNFLDLRGIECPANFIKAKLRLAKLSNGETLTLYVDEGEPIDRVPTSLRMDGHDIVFEDMLADGSGWQLKVQKCLD